MLQQDEPEDFVIATGVTTTVREFVKLAFEHVGIELEFNGEGLDEKGSIKAMNQEYDHLKVGQILVSIDENYFRPTEVDLLIGDPTKAKTKLGWEPTYDLKALISEMVAEDLEYFTKQVRNG